MDEKVTELLMTLVSEMKWISLCIGIMAIVMLMAFVLYFTGNKK